MQWELHKPAQLGAQNDEKYSDITGKEMIEFNQTFDWTKPAQLVAQNYEKYFDITGIRDDWIQPCLSVIFAILYAVKTAVAYTTCSTEWWKILRYNRCKLWLNSTMSFRNICDALFSEKWTSLCNL